MLKTITNQSILVPLLFICSLITKIYYGSTRNIFSSGPDANTFTQMGIDLANIGYLNSGVAGLPIYSPGYGFFLALNKKFFGDNWILIAQIFQSFFSSISALFLFMVSSRFLNKNFSILTLIIMLFHPAILVASVSSMYESLAIFFLSILIYLSITYRKKIALITFSTISSMLILVHPRFIPMAMIIFIINCLDKKFQKNLTIITIYMIINLSTVFLVLYRNSVFSNYTGLAAGTKYGLEYGHPSLGKCENLIRCLASVKSNSGEFIKESFINAMNFLSPWSGPLERGTWFHNISFYTLLQKNNLLLLSSLLSAITTIFMLILLLFGFRHLRRNDNKIFEVFVAIGFICLLTDSLVYGDSRHRLVFLNMSVLVITLSMQVLYESIKRQFTSKS